eukprot:scaffold14121_cov67-Phaeocystis_antarctica.AAC.7
MTAPGPQRPCRLRRLRRLRHQYRAAHGRAWLSRQRGGATQRAPAPARARRPAASLAAAGSPTPADTRRPSAAPPRPPHAPLPPPRPGATRPGGGACAAVYPSNSARASACASRASQASASAATRRSRSSSSWASSAAARPHPDPALLVLERLPPALLMFDSLLPDRPDCAGLSGRAAAVASANAVSARCSALAGESCCCSELVRLDRLLPDRPSAGLLDRAAAVASANVVSMRSRGESCCCSELVRLVSATRWSLACFGSLFGVFTGLRNAAEHILFAIGRAWSRPPPHGAAGGVDERLDDLLKPSGRPENERV